MARIGVVCVLLLSVGAVWSAQFCSATNIECRDGKAMLARHWDLAFSEDFEQGLGAWQTENYENNLKLELSPDQPHSGASTFRVSWVKDTDTAWELESPPIEIGGGNPFELRFWARSNRGLTATSPHQGHYDSASSGRTPMARSWRRRRSPTAMPTRRGMRWCWQARRPLGRRRPSSASALTAPTSPVRNSWLSMTSVCCRGQSSLGMRPAGSFCQRAAARLAGALGPWTAEVAGRGAAGDQGGCGRPRWPPTKRAGRASGWTSCLRPVAPSAALDRDCGWFQYRVRMSTPVRQRTACALAG